MYQFLTDGLKYHDQYAYVQKIIEDNKIGIIKNIQSVCSYPLPKSDNIRLNPNLNGGVFYDSIGYPVSAALLILKKLPSTIYCYISKNKTFDVDDYVSIQMSFETNINVNVFASLGSQYDTKFKIYGSKGSLELTKAFAMKNTESSKIVLNLGFEHQEIIFDPQDLFLKMIKTFSKHILYNTDLNVNSIDEIFTYQKIMDYAIESDKDKKLISNLIFKMVHKIYISLHHFRN